MTALLAVTGLAVVLAATIDVVWTTLAAGSGGGPITSGISQAMWRLALRLHRPGHRRSHLMLRLVGLGVLAAVLALWLLLLWGGWTLVLASDPEAIVHTSDGRSASVFERMYVAGYSLFTLGNGECRPTSWSSQLAVVGCTASGLLLISLAITFLVSVVSAATQRQQLAGYIGTLGERAEDIVVDAWTHGYDNLAFALAPLPAMLTGVGRRQFAYPVLHYLHAVERTTAAAPAIAALDEALTLLAHGVHPDDRPPSGTLLLVQRAIGGLLESLSGRFFVESSRPPPGPSLEVLRQAGIRTVDDSDFVASLAERATRRRLLAGFVEHDGWAWGLVGRSGDGATDLAMGNRLMRGRRG